MSTQAKGTARSVWFAILFALTCVASSSSFLSVNVISRLALTHAIVDRGELSIDPVADFTIDKAYWRGHYYCDKAPGVSLLCVPAGYLANLVSDLAGFPEPLLVTQPFVGNTMARYVLMTAACFLFTTVLFAALAVYAFQRTLLRLGVDPRAAAIATVALAFASPFYIWSTTLFGHATGAALLFLGFATAWLRTTERARFLIGGLVLSLAMLTDLTTVPAGLIVCAYLVFADGERQPKVIFRRSAWLFVGALPSAITLAVYNQLAFGSPWHLGYSSVDGFEGMKTGFFGLSYPSLGKLYGITFGQSRGLVWVSPISFAALLALLLPWPREHRPIFAMITAIAGYYLLLNASYFYWTGGGALGPRHLTPMIPFVLLSLALRLSSPGVGNRTLWAAAGVTALSLVITLVCVSIDTQIPDDGRPMLTTHILPYLSEMGMNFEKLGFKRSLWPVFAQWLLALRAAALLGVPALRRKSPAI